MTSIAKIVPMLALTLTLGAGIAQAQTTTDTTTGTTDTTTGTTDTTVTTPGVPNTGAGGNAAENALILTGTGAVALLGATYLLRSRTR